MSFFSKTLRSWMEVLRIFSVEDDQVCYHSRHLNCMLHVKLASFSNTETNCSENRVFKTGINTIRAAYYYYSITIQYYIKLQEPNFVVFTSYFVRVLKIELLRQDATRKFIYAFEQKRPTWNKSSLTLTINLYFTQLQWFFTA